MNGGLRRLALVTVVALPLVAAPQDFVCANADDCTEMVRMGVAGSLERLTALAEGGDAAAQVRLGLYYLGAMKTPSQPSGDSWLEGTKWLRMAAAQGNPEALHRLAGMLMETDRLRFYRFAAEQGYAPAQFDLASAYLGKGNPVQYRKWLQLSLQKPGMPFRLSEFIETDPKMTPTQLAEGDRLAREWKPKTWAELLAADGAN